MAMTTTKSAPFSSCLASLLLAAAAVAQAAKPVAEPLRVVASLPDLGSIATAIGGEFVHVPGVSAVYFIDAAAGSGHADAVGVAARHQSSP